MNCPFRFGFLTVAVLATLIGVGVAHGIWTDRWPADDERQALLEKLPWSVGDWDGKSIKDESSSDALPDADKFLMRRYVNHLDGSVATIMLTRGRHGPMLIKHLPTECYPSAGYETAMEPKRFVSQSADTTVPDEFWVATFKKTTDIVPSTQRLYWSWSGDGRWQTPERPRFTFASYRTIYKVYIVQHLVNEQVEFEGAPVHEFIKELTKAMRESLFASAQR
jgi:hypothetical protein